MASPYTSVKSGDWDDPATWGQATYPQTAGDVVTVSNPHVVVYNVNSAVQLAKVTVNFGGTLRCSRTMNTRLALGAAASSLLVNGTMRWGNSELEPIPAAYTAIIEFATTGNTGSFNADASTGDVKFYGDPAYQPTRQTRLVSTWAAGQTITVAGDVTNWRVGDSIVVDVHLYTTSPHANGLFYATIASRALNGANTDITINEAFPAGRTFYERGIVTNLDSHNIIIRKVGATSGVNTAVGAAPYFVRSGGAFPTDYTYVTTFNNVTFHGCYYVRGEYNLQIKRCVLKNMSYGVYACSNLTIEDGIFFSCNYAIWSSNNAYIKNNSIFGCISGLTYLFYRATIDGGEFFASTYACVSSYDLIFNGVDFFAIGYVIYTSQQSIFNDCYFFSCSGAGCGVAEFNRCSWGYDEIGEIKQMSNNEIYWMTGSKINFIFRDCTIRWNNDSIYPTLDGAGNSHYLHSTGAIYSGNHSNNPGDNRAYFCFGYALSHADHYLAAGSLQVTPFSYCGTTYQPNLGTTNIEIFSWTENNVPASAQARRIYLKGTGWLTMPTSAELWFEVEYYNAAGAWTRTILKSTEVISANDTWTAFTVSFVPAKVGIVKYRAYLAKYRSGAKVYIDHALYYSATEFLQAQYDGGKSILPMAPPPTFPAAADVRELTAYGTPLVPLVGVLDLPAEGDVRDGVFFDSLTKEGDLVLPAEAQVLLDVGFGAAGTEFTGELALEIPGATLTIPDNQVDLDLGDPLNIDLEVT